MTEKAVLAGGCFWGMQDLFRRHPGVVSTRVGYTGDLGTVPLLIVAVIVALRRNHFMRHPRPTG